MVRYEQFTMYARKKLKGAYRYKDYINIFMSNDENKPFESAEPFTVEVAFEAADPYYRYGSPWTSTPLGKKKLEVMHLLSLFLMYEISYASDTSNNISQFTKHDNISTPFGEPRYYQKLILNDLTTDELLLPKDLDLMFEAYMGLDEEKYKVFRNAMHHFFTGVTIEKTTIHFQ